MTKAELRKQVAALRPDFIPSSDGLQQTGQSLEEMSEAVLKNLQGVGLFQQAQTVGAYMPLPDEVNVTPLFEHKNKTFYIPAFDEAAGGYRMAKYTPELKKGKFGIPEPLEPVWATDELDLILVPGIAFDRTGIRLGRGGGFYDRLLPQYRAVRAGICFDFQILEKLPSEPHDCKMDLLITESEILKFATNC